MCLFSQSQGRRGVKEHSSYLWGKNVTLFSQNHCITLHLPKTRLLKHYSFSVNKFNLWVSKFTHLKSLNLVIAQFETVVAAPPASAILYPELSRRSVTSHSEGEAGIFVQISPQQFECQRHMLMLNVKGATQTDTINARPVQESPVSRWISPLLFSREFG